MLWSQGEPCLITGPVGVGKTTIVGRLTRGRLGLDRHLLGYPIRPGERRVLYLACDRPRQISRNLARMMDPADREVLADRLRVWAGPPPADLAKHTSFLLDMARKAVADTVVLDGLKDVALELSKDDVGAGLNQAFQRCVAEGVEVIGNHHQRKAAAGGAATKPRSLNDLYGSTWIGAGAGPVILVWADAAGAAVVEVSTLKPAYDSVGPVTVVHDLDQGTLTVHEALDLETILRAAAPVPRSLAELAASLGMVNVDRNQREHVRRQLHRLEQARVVDVFEVPAPTGGMPEEQWLWRAG